jgi:hypothetical protein
MVEPQAFLNVDTFDHQHDTKFIKNHVAPYFTEIYKDLLSREPVGAKGISRMIFQEVSRYVICSTRVSPVSSMSGSSPFAMPTTIWPFRRTSL